ncbi:MAG: hypothetical protein CMF41_01195 [Legionellales bacterium]|nr:hypothetical protein [Legionellales bacterium]
MIVGYLKVNDKLSIRYKMETDKKKLVGYQWFDGEIIKIVGDTYTVKFVEDGSVERLILGNLEWKKKEDDLIADDEDDTSGEDDLFAGLRGGDSDDDSSSSSDDSYMSSDGELTCEGEREGCYRALGDVYEENVQLKTKLENAQKDMEDVLKKTHDIAIMLIKLRNDLNDLKMKYKI